MSLGGRAPVATRRHPLGAGALAARLRGDRSGARGSLLAAMLVVMTIGSIMLAMASTEWSFIMRREREKELIFRGVQIARAVDEWQSDGRAPPTTLEAMTKPPRPVLRKAYADPMTARYDDEGKLVEGTGEWVYLTLGSNQPTLPGALASAPAPASASARGLSSRNVPQIVPILGVQSSSEEISIGMYMDEGPEAAYVDWKFKGLGTRGVTGALEGGYEIPRPPGFGGLRLPGGPPVGGLSGNQQLPTGQQQQRGGNRPR